MIRRPPRSTRTDTPFPTRRSSDLVHAADQTVEAALIPARQTRAGLRVRPLRHFGPEPLRMRSEEHTSELQSLMRISYAVFCLKKKKNKKAKELTQYENETNEDEIKSQVKYRTTR